MKKEIIFAKRYLTQINLMEGLSETEFTYWKYRNFLNYLDANDTKYNSKLLEAINIKRKKYLEGRLR